MDKLLDGLTIKLTSDTRMVLRGIAEADGTSESEYVRNLILTDLQRRRDHFLALASIFGETVESAQQREGQT